MEQLVEVFGQSEMQDSLVIGFLQYFMGSNNYYCRICNKPFKQKQQQDNDLSYESSASSVDTNKLDPAEEVKKLGCNAEHYFHKACLA